MKSGIKPRFLFSFLFSFFFFFFFLKPVPNRNGTATVGTIGSIGTILGEGLGDGEGLIDGDTEGLGLGEGDGLGDGEGLIDGEIDGLTLGEIDGEILGEIEGDILGLIDGLILGEIEAEADEIEAEKLGDIEKLGEIGKLGLLDIFFEIAVLIFAFAIIWLVLNLGEGVGLNGGTIGVELITADTLGEGVVGVAPRNTFEFENTSFPCCWIVVLLNASKPRSNLALMFPLFAKGSFSNWNFDIS